MHFIKDIANISSIIVHHKELINVIGAKFDPNSLKEEPASKLVPLVMNAINLLVDIIFEQARTCLLEVVDLFVHDQLVFKD